MDYSTPLTKKQMEDHGLRGAYDNPDLFRYSPRQFHAQIQVVGTWEKMKNTPTAKRLTEWEPDIKQFRLKNNVIKWPLNVQYQKITEELPTNSQEYKRLLQSRFAATD